MTHPRFKKNNLTAVFWGKLKNGVLWTCKVHGFIQKGSFQLNLLVNQIHHGNPCYPSWNLALDRYPNITCWKGNYPLKKKTKKNIMNHFGYPTPGDSSPDLLYPLFGGHQQPLKGSRFHHPKKLHQQNCQNFRRRWCARLMAAAPLLIGATGGMPVPPSLVIFSAEGCDGWDHSQSCKKIRWRLESNFWSSSSPIIPA